MVDRKYTARPGAPEAPPASDDDGAWFAARRYGYGAGLPLRRQGWALVLAYLGLLGGLKLLDTHGGAFGRGGAFALFVAGTAVFLIVTARHTRGGWKWRWGKPDSR